MVALNAKIIRGAVAPPFGNGYGYGDGYGNGYGYGYGNGYGNGDGYGNGYGNGNGYGDGYGDGYGYGYGDGYGDGDGDGSYWLACLKYFLALLPAGAQRRAEELQQKNVKLAYWRSNGDGQPANHSPGKLDVAPAPGVVHEVTGPLELCTSRALHATLIPTNHKGERWWIVALHGAVVGDDDKFGCLKREIIGEIL